MGEGVYLSIYRSGVLLKEGRGGGEKEGEKKGEKEKKGVYNTEDSSSQLLRIMVSKRPQFLPPLSLFWGP